MLGTTELQCFGETRGRVPYGAESGNDQRGNFSWTELGKSTKMRGETAVQWCWHKEQL